MASSSSSVAQSGSDTGSEIAREWTAFMHAPYITLGLVAIVGLFIWAALHFIYKNRIEGLKESLQKEKDETGRLRRRIGEGLPQPNQTDPDGIYQHGRRVGKAVLPDVDLSHSLIKFQAITGNGQFDREAPFVYREWVLEIAELQSWTDAEIGGTTFQSINGVFAKIISARP